MGDRETLATTGEIDALRNTMMNQAKNYAHYIKLKLDEDIAFIILFGSLAKKNMSIHSDIDILIIHFGNRKFEEKLPAETFNYMVETGAPIEYLAYGYFQAKYNPTYFLKYNLDNGVLLYMKNQESIKRKEREGYITLFKQIKSQGKSVTN